MLPGSGIPGYHVVAQISDRLDAAASGVLSTATTSIIAGSAVGSAAASGAVLLADLTLDAGVPTGSAVVSGDTLAITPSIIAGEAVGDAIASGTVLNIGTTVIAGMASGDQQHVRIAGGSAFVRRRGASGAVLEMRTSIIPGSVQIGHEIYRKDQHGRTLGVITIFGATDEQLRSDDLAIALLTDDLDGWLSGIHEEAA